MIREIEINDIILDNSAKIFIFLLKNIYIATTFTWIYLLLMLMLMLLYLLGIGTNLKEIFILANHLGFLMLMSPLLHVIEEYYHIKSIRIINKVKSINKLVAEYDYLMLSCIRIGVYFHGEFDPKELLFIHSAAPICVLIIIFILIMISILLKCTFLIRSFFVLVCQPLFSLVPWKSGSDGEKIMTLRIISELSCVETVYYCITGAFKALLRL